MSDKQQRLMKDGLDRAAVERIAANLGRVWRPFPRERFIRTAATGLDALELKQRVAHVITALHDCLPDDFARTAPILTATGRRWQSGGDADALTGFAAWPVIDYVAVHGLDHPELALDTLAELTPLFSAEFAVRPFLIHHESLTLARLAEWTAHPDEHVRRLVSEGTRPRLPWGERLSRFIADPHPVIQLLDVLRDDSSEYVRRSVANNVNDISKDHPDLVVRTCRRWQRARGGDAAQLKNRQRLIARATRTLVKESHPDVWALLGYADPPEVRVTGLRLAPQTIRIGQAVTLCATIHSPAHAASQRLVIDYAVHHVKAAGHTTAKVFKLRTVALPPGEKLTISKRHDVRRITTRRYHPGRHSVELLINGRSFGRRNFQLLES
ncbi:MAG: hypothetical protein R3C10_10005 [Pirellulales bacterium]